MVQCSVPYTFYASTAHFFGCGVTLIYFFPPSPFKKLDGGKMVFSVISCLFSSHAATTITFPFCRKIHSGPNSRAPKKQSFLMHFQALFACYISAQPKICYTTDMQICIHLLTSLEDFLLSHCCRLGSQKYGFF